MRQLPPSVVLVLGALALTSLASQAAVAPRGLDFFPSLSVNAKASLRASVYNGVGMENAMALAVAAEKCKVPLGGETQEVAAVLLLSGAQTDARRGGAWARLSVSQAFEQLPVPNCATLAAAVPALVADILRQGEVLAKQADDQRIALENKLAPRHAVDLTSSSINNAQFKDGSTPISVTLDAAGSNAASSETRFFFDAQGEDLSQPTGPTLGPLQLDLAYANYRCDGSKPRTANASLAEGPIPGEGLKRFGTYVLNCAPAVGIQWFPEVPLTKPNGSPAVAYARAGATNEVLLSTEGLSAIDANKLLSNAIAASALAMAKTCQNHPTVPRLDSLALSATRARPGFDVGLRVNLLCS